MMKISQVIKKNLISFAGCGNIIVHQYGIDDFRYDQFDHDVISVNPFVVKVHDRHILLVRREDDENIIKYEYAIYVNKIPTKANYTRGEIKFLAWLKHPMIVECTPDDIVESWRGKFLYKKEEPEKHIYGLRSPQLGALYAFMSREQSKHGRNIIVMPTGTGKTETMLSILVANQCKKLLVTVPSDALRGQLHDKFVSMGILHEFGIVSNDCIYPNVAIVKNSPDINQWNTIIENSNVIVTTMSLITHAGEDVKTLLSKSITQVFVDEAHHSKAETWEDFINAFPEQKVTLFTATPFRNDGKKLDGDFIYSFSLKDAQKQGYYKPIQLLPIREYDMATADKVIAERAVQQLREDMSHGYDHILMARCSTQKRAEEVMEYYRQYEDLNPVVVHSSMVNTKAILESIRKHEHRIIVCVNMLGEGFDLPNMKIAAIHDARQSIAITLQFIGRFTRTAYDENLGSASFVTNIAFPPIQEEIRELYAKDADWNRLLPLLNDGATQEEIDLNEYINSFKNVDSSNVPFQNIHPALSAVIYRVGRYWNPNEWEKVFDKEHYTYRFSSINSNGDTLILILGHIDDVGWGNTSIIQNVSWDIVIVHHYCTPQYNHAYVNSSFDFNTDSLIKAIFGNADNISKLSGNNIFRVLSDVKRFAITNFGGRKIYPGNLSFKSYYGKDVEEALGLIEQKKLSKNNIFGVGYRRGERISVGCSLKGKVWSRMRGNILQFNMWAHEVGKMIEDESINPNAVLSNTLVPKLISHIPQVQPLNIDWDPDLYVLCSETHIFMVHENNNYNLWDVEISLVEREISDDIKFEITASDAVSRYCIKYGAVEGVPYYNVSRILGPKLGFKLGKKTFDDICEYFNQDNSAPVIYFANGSSLYANVLVEPRSVIEPYDKDLLIPLNWAGVNLKKESQKVIPYETDSIQYHFSKIIENDFDVLYDDDGSGEIADLIGIKEINDIIHVHLYHLKFALDGVVSNRIDNFYVVCGQAQKCLKWNDREKNRDLFTRLFARITKRSSGRECSRLIKGTMDNLEYYSDQINWKKDIKFHISIVQPALSKAHPSEDILRLLGVVSTHVKDVANIDLKVYCSE